MKFKLALIVALLLLLLVVSNARAGRLDDYCLSFIHPQTTAALCDPGGRVNGVISLGPQSRLIDHNGSAVIDRPLALQQGEVVQASWQHASATAVLYVSGGGYSVALPLHSLGSRATVRINRTDLIEAIGNRRRLITKPIDFNQAPFWAPTPESAVKQIRLALSNLRSDEALQSLCRSLDPGSRRFYLYFYGLPDQPGCLGALRVFFLGSDAPSDRVQSSQSQLVNITKAGPEVAYVYLKLVHYFAPDGDNPQAIPTQATIMLRRDRQGVWRLANPQSLMPLNVYRVRSEKPASTANQAWSEWRQLVAKGRFWQLNYLARHFPWLNGWGASSMMQHQ